MGVLALIGLGSNLGDRRGNLESALDALRALPDCTLCAVSGFHQTQAVGGPQGQHPFLNAAAAIETSLEPLELLHILQAIEAAAGRKREVRWGPRPIDLDLLLFGDSVIDSPELVVPHLHFALRRFVLAPLAEVAPEAVDPLTGRTVRQLLSNLDRRPSYVALAGDLADDPQLLSAIAADLPSAIEITWRELMYAEAAALSEDGSLDLEGARAFLSEAAHPLRLERWANSLAEDSWIMTGTSLDDLFFDVNDRLDFASRPALREFYLQIRSHCLQPTFVALDWFQAEEPLNNWLRQALVDDPIGRDTPMLRVRRLDVARLRGLIEQAVIGDASVMEQALAGIEQFKAEARSVFHDEIRAACAAGRSSE